MSNTPPTPLAGSSESSFCDGFAVLPNGNFLINDGDGTPVYREYYSSGNNAGSQRLPADGGPVIDLSPYVPPPPDAIYSGATGVSTAPDGTLYFAAGYIDQAQEHITTTLVQTNLTSHTGRLQNIGRDFIEDIDIVIP